jgi:WD40 repeat protein
MAVHHVVPQPDGDDDDDDGNIVDSSSQKLTVATTGAVLKLVTLDTTMDTTDDHDEQALNYSADVIHHFAFSSNGQHAIAGGDHGIIQLWKNIHNNLDDDDAGELTSIRLRGMATHVVSVSFSTDSKYVAAVGMAGAIKVWNVQTASLQKVRPVATSYDPFRANSNNIVVPSGIGHIKFTPDGTMLAATGNDGSIRFWSRDAWDRQR